MERKKLERLILLILLLLNLFLLAAVWTKQAAAERERRETHELIAQLLRDGGIEPAAEVELVRGCPGTCTLERSMSQEEQFARALLGKETEEEELGGSIWSYRSSAGVLVMRGTGEAELRFTEDHGISFKDAQRAFASAGVELHTVSEERTGAELFQTCRCQWGGFPVYNAVLNFRFSEGALREAAGTLPFAGGQSSAGADGMDSVTALVRFLNLVRSEGIICSRLEALNPGYMMYVTVSGESTLTPVWHIVTDTVELYLDAVTGANAGSISG